MDTPLFLIGPIDVLGEGNSPNQRDDVKRCFTCQVKGVLLGAWKANEAIRVFDLSRRQKAIVKFVNAS